MTVHVKTMPAETPLFTTLYKISQIVNLSLLPVPLPLPLALYMDILLAAIVLSTMPLLSYITGSVRLCTYWIAMIGIIVQITYRGSSLSSFFLITGTAYISIQYRRIISAFFLFQQFQKYADTFFCRAFFSHR